MLEANLASIERRIEAAATSAGRDPSEITLIAVTKTVPIDRIQEAYDLGLRHFGESRLQEALPKIEALPDDITWHFIGKLQSNKAKKAAQHFPIIHTLENAAQVREIDKAGRPVDGLLELNIANESQKSGISTESVDDLLQCVIQSLHVRYRGLMTIGPNLSDPEQMRPYFKRLRELGERVGADWLSMGMSADFDVAIQEGATHIRVGSALFGERH